MYRSKIPIRQFARAPATAEGFERNSQFSSDGASNVIFGIGSLAPLAGYELSSGHAVPVAQDVTIWLSHLVYQGDSVASL
jgi:hypothetical protein